MQRLYTIKMREILLELCVTFIYKSQQKWLRFFRLDFFVLCIFIGSIVAARCLIIGFGCILADFEKMHKSWCQIISFTGQIAIRFYNNYKNCLLSCRQTKKRWWKFHAKNNATIKVIGLISRDNLYKKLVCNQRHKEGQRQTIGQEVH